MKHNIIVITMFLFSLIGFGCQEQLTKVEDTTSFEKRTPIGVNDSVRKQPIDSIKRRIPIESVLPCLNLSKEQMDKIKFILKESRTCEIECKLKLKTTMESLIILPIQPDSNHIILTNMNLQNNNTLIS